MSSNFCHVLKIEVNNLYFDEGERIEDVDWVHRLTHYAKSTQYQPILFIHYIKNDTSTTMTSYKSKETMYSTVRCGRRLCELSNELFSKSSEIVRQKIQQLGVTVMNLGMRNYLFCYDLLLSGKTCSGVFHLKVYRTADMPSV